MVGKELTYEQIAQGVCCKPFSDAVVQSVPEQSQVLVSTKVWLKKGREGGGRSLLCSFGLIGINVSTQCNV